MLLKPQCVRKYLPEEVMVFDEPSNIHRLVMDGNVNFTFSLCIFLKIWFKFSNIWMNT